MNRPVLITGCSGFLASHLIPLLKKENPDTPLVGITEVESFACPEIKVIRLDIRDRDGLIRVVEEIKPELCFHLAALTSVALSWKNPKLTYEVNIIGSSNLLESLSRLQGTRVLLLSSAEVYESSGKPITERGRVCWRNPYALSKLAMEQLGLLYGNAKNMQAVIVRAFNIIGPGQDRQFVVSDFSAQIAAIEKGLREPVLRVGNLSAVRDFTDVHEAVRFLAVIAGRGEAGQIYNLGSGRPRSIQQILDTLISLSRTSIRLEMDQEKFRPLDAPVIVADCGRVRKKFGLQAQIPLEQTLEEVLEYWRRMPV